MSIWTREAKVADLQRISENTAVSHLGIEFTRIGDDELVARLPVDARTRQPLGLLHGGVSVVLAETLASVGAYLCCAEDEQVVGLEVNANHIRAAERGHVTGTARALHLGRTTQVWQVEIRDERDKLVCVSRVTMAVLKSQGGNPQR